MKQMKLHQNRGFTLIEIMVVVVILGILAALIVPKIISRPEQARFTKAKSDIQAIQTALDLYKLDNGVYPSTDQGLLALVERPTSDPQPTNWKPGGYLQQVPLDPWKHPYNYLNPGTNNTESVDIFTYGPTNKPGAQMIGNWNTEK
jgi:general secretion pathway protein G